MKSLELFYENKEEPVKSCLLALRHIILNCDDRFEEAWKYRMPMFCIKGKMVCYLWTGKKTGYPYLGVCDGKKIDFPGLIIEKNARMKKFKINPYQDIPLKDLEKLMSKVVGLY